MMLQFLKLLDFPTDWNDKLNIFLILFSAGLLCVLCAILMAFYLMKSDRFTSKSSEKSKFSKYPPLYKESRLSRIKFKFRSLFGAIKDFFTGSENEFDDYSYEDIKEPPETPPEPPEQDTNSSDEDA